MSRPEKRSIDLEATETMAKAKQSDPNLQEVKQDGGITRAGLKVLVLLAFQNCVKNLVMSAPPCPATRTSCIPRRSSPPRARSACHVIYLVRSMYGRFSTDDLLIPKDGVAQVRAAGGAGGHLQLPANFGIRGAAESECGAVFRLGSDQIADHSHLLRWFTRQKVKTGTAHILVLLTTGVMLAQLRPDRGEASNGESVTTGILATLGIALSSGFAAVYTEKVIKRVGTTQQTATAPPVSGLAYTQIQLAMTSLVIEGGWAFATDGAAIRERGLWDGFDYKACISVFNSAAAGGLTVAAVLKYADAVLKGYATAVSVVLTGLLSMLFFGTTLSVEYALGMVNVFAAIVLYNVRDLTRAW